jgi:hypothetical protein
MAVTLFMRVPELTLGKYDDMMLSLGLDASPPAGLILHAASEAVGAVNVMEIWQTPQAAEGFVHGRLREALAAQKVKDPLSYRIEPLYNLYACNVDMIERIGAMSLPAAIARTALVS